MKLPYLPPVIEIMQFDAVDIVMASDKYVESPWEE